MATIFGYNNFNFQEIFLKDFSERKKVELRGITVKPGKVINSNDMTKLLKKEQHGVITQLCSSEVATISKMSWTIIPGNLRISKDSHLFVIMIMLFI